MRKGKKIVWSVVMLAMALSMAACGKSKEDYFAERMEEMGGSLNVSEDDENAQQIKDLMDGLAEDFANQKVEEKKKVTDPAGVWEGNTYTNEYLGLTVEFGPEWETYNAEEILQREDTVGGMFNSSGLGDLMEEADFFEDMLVENRNDMSSMNVYFIKMTKEQQEERNNQTERQIVLEGIEDKSALKDIYAGVGMEIQTLTAKDVYFLGEKRTVQYMHIDYNGTPYYAIQILDYHSGDYASSMTIACYNEDKTEELLNLFTKCE